MVIWVGSDLFWFKRTFSSLKMATYIKTDNGIFVKKDGTLKEINNIEECSDCNEYFEINDLISVEDIVLCFDCFIGAINVMISKGKL